MPLTKTPPHSAPSNNPAMTRPGFVEGRADPDGKGVVVAWLIIASGI
ncbi:hypothetical protein [Caulobacter sp. Root655]|nr:hypothetical protein [Caulobacter sp. Root655]